MNGITWKGSVWIHPGFQRNSFQGGAWGDWQKFDQMSGMQFKRDLIQKGVGRWVVGGGIVDEGVPPKQPSASVVGIGGNTALVSGNYEDRGNELVVEFRDGNARWFEGRGLNATSGQTAATQDRDKVTFYWRGRPFVLTQNPDGTLTGDEHVTLKKIN